VLVASKNKRYSVIELGRYRGRIVEAPFYAYLHDMCCLSSHKASEERENEEETGGVKEEEGHEGE